MGNRNTVRRNFSITQRADMALEEMSDEWDMSRSEIVSKAVLEYTDRDRTARMEEKLDEVLDRLDAPKTDGGTLSENPVQKEKRTAPADTHTFDPVDYDPEADRNPLTKDELKQLLKEVDEPVINPDHVEKDTVETIRDNDPQDAALAGIIRYDHDQEVIKEDYVEDYVRDYLGSTDYILDQHPDGIIDHFYPYEYLVEDDSGYSFEKIRTLYYLHRSDWIDHLKDTLIPIQETADQPFTTLPDDMGNSWNPSYAKMGRWLAAFQDDLIDADLASREEITDLIEEIGRQQDEVNTALAELDDEFRENEWTAPTFTTEEAAETLSCDTDQVEVLMTIGINRGLAEETSDGYEITK